MQHDHNFIKKNTMNAQRRIRTTEKIHDKRMND